MTLSDDLARMEAEDKAATPGPWYAVRSREQVGKEAYNIAAYQRGGELGDDDDVYSVSSKPKAAGWTTDGGCPGYGVAIENATAMASARTDRPALVELVRLLSAKLRRIMEPGGDPDLRVNCYPETIDELLNEFWSEAKEKAGGS